MCSFSRLATNVFAYSVEGESGIPALVRKLFHSSSFLNRSAMFEFEEVRDTEQTNVSV